MNDFPNSMSGFQHHMAFEYLGIYPPSFLLQHLVRRMIRSFRIMTDMKILDFMNFGKTIRF